MLDTNTVSFALRGVGDVHEHVLAHSPSDLCLSAITESELWFGVAKRRSKRLARLVEAFLEPLKILAFDSHAARTYGELRTALEKRGEAIGIADTQIAAHALSQQLILVTNNRRHFTRVRGLSVEDWR